MHGAQHIYKAVVNLDISNHPQLSSLQLRILQASFNAFPFTIVSSAVVIHTMAGGGSKKGVAATAALVGLGVLVVMAMMADSTEAAGVCNPNALYPCLRAIQGARPPSPSKQCCAVVKGVDKTCMCRQLKAGSFPAQMVSNALRLPKKCGRIDLRGFKCGRYTFPY